MAPKKGSKGSEVCPTRESLINSLKRTKSLIEKSSASMILSELETRLSLVESNFSQLASLQTELEQYGDDEPDFNKRYVIEDLYCDTKAKILHAIAQCRRNRSHPTETDHLARQPLNSTSLSAPRSVKLPKLKLPIFSGKYTEWTNWYNTFVSLVDDEQDLDELSKFVHLRSCLSPIPLRTIESLEVTAQNYSHAISLLKARFDNRPIIFQSHIRELFDLHRIPHSHPASLRGLVDTVNSHLRSLQSLGSAEDLTNVILFYLIRSKVDREALEKWDDEFSGDKLPSWELLSKFISNRCTVLENREINTTPSVGGSRQRNQPSPGQDFPKKMFTKQAKSLTATVSKGKIDCPSCGSAHCIAKCPGFIALDPIQRYFEAKKHKLCLLCLLAKHSVKSCKSSRCELCQGAHNVLLHRDVPQDLKTTGALTLDSNPKDELNAAQPISLLSSCSTNILATASILIQNREGKFIPGRALLDSGSQLNFVTSRLAARLNIKANGTKMIISGIGGSTSAASGQISTYIKSRLTNFVAKQDFLIMPEITQYAPVNAIPIENWHLPKNIQLADPNFNGQHMVDMLLGVGVFFKILSVGQIMLGENLPLLQKSLFGWIIAGECRDSESPMQRLTVHTSTVPEATRLTELVEKFWKCEHFIVNKSLLTPDEQFCEDQFISTVKQDSMGRLVVRLPFKNNSCCLGESYNIALKRYLTLERRLDQNRDLKNEYTAFINEYNELDHLEEVRENINSECQYFMPHHAVLRPQSLTTKLRVVFDASCKSSNGMSLNDNLLVGSRIQPELLEVLIRFRFYNYALTADISKMYRQILVDKEDCKWQCILWREDNSERIKALRLKTVTYGTTSAPFLAVRCLKYLADTYKNQYPIAHKIVTENFYMDDMLAGANTIEDLKQVQAEVIQLLGLGQFKLHKWRSNCAQWLCELPTANKISHPLSIPTGEEGKTLGVLWDSTKDIFRFCYSSEKSAKITKRVVLSELAQLFDPMGLLNPIIVLGKIFMQELWLLKLDWDESLPQGLHEQWKRFRSQLNLISNIEFPRLVAPRSNKSCLQIHGFCDASNRAYGCAIYARTIDQYGHVWVELIAAKSRISPIKSQSLPRLELQGALLLVNFFEQLRHFLPSDINAVYYWTDSTLVLNWLHSHPSKWSTFIANRVSQIQAFSKNVSWRKVDSSSNPADIVSRGMLPKDLINSQLWRKGPQFLSSAQLSWTPQTMPVFGGDVSEMEERKLNFSLAMISNVFEDITANCKFLNDFLKLQAVFGYIFRWVEVVRKKPLSVGALTVAELRGGLLYLIHNIQRVSFCEDFELLLSNKYAKSCKIQKLNPFIDNSGQVLIIRVGGRLQNSDLSFQSMHPILLPGDHSCTMALVRFLHKINSHAGPQALAAFLRQRFWVINARKITRKVVRACVPCFRQKPTLATQLMGNLPSYRVVGNAKPFERSGMDFAGPISIHFKVRGKKPTKAYLSIFVCFLTKACHIEVVSDLSTSAFISALKRFFARRGLCTDLFCDNATNFVGASREMKELATQFFNDNTKTKLQEECAVRGVNFHFIPPRSPHFGGLWESAVKVAKHLLVPHINNASLTFEELSTVTAQIEAIMNSRPISPLSSDPNDLEALTPGHFLIGRPLNAFPEPFKEEKLNISPVSRWSRILLVQQTFWKRWSREYLALLQERQKWTEQCGNIAAGTLVLIAEDNSHPHRWLLGRVVETYPGSDGLIRVVSVRTATGVFKRNVHKICPLPIGP